MRLPARRRDMPVAGHHHAAGGRLLFVDRVARSPAPHSGRFSLDSLEIPGRFGDRGGAIATSRNSVISIIHSKSVLPRASPHFERLPLTGCKSAAM